MFRPLAGLLGVAALAAAARAQESAASGPDGAAAAVESDEIVVSATRSRQDPRYTPSSVTLLSLTELELSQVVELRAALAREPGVGVVNTGATGSQSSIFTRGASGHQTLLFVDGVRMNDRSAAYINFLGGADLGGLGRLEVLRGPQGTLYGSSAMGGVVLMDTAPVGDTPASGRVSAHAGSFDTWGGALEVSGGAGAFGYSAAAGYGETANDRDGNDYDAWNGAARLEFAPASAPVKLGVTLRHQDGRYEEPGSTQFAFPGIVDSANTLGTAFAEWRPSDGFTSRLTAARHERDYRFTSVPDLFGPSVTENRRDILDWQNTWSASPQLELVGGLNLERARYTIGDTGTRDDVAAGYVSAIYRAAENVTLTAGARHDDFDSVGSPTTWRTGVAWNLAPATKLRATVGTGFCAPGSDDRYGVPQWGQLPNPGLEPEETTGWDVGVDQTFGNGAVTASATYFHQRYDNLFDWEYVNFETFEGMIVNRAHATTEGVETALTARLHRAVTARAGYTWLEARNDTDDTRLVRRPRHTFDAEVTTRPAAAWVVGAGVHVVADRVESFVGPVEDYTTVRLFGSWRATEDLLVKVRVENLLDEEYEEVLGYPALPLGVFGGVEWRF